MTLEVIMPGMNSGEKNVKDLVFSILTEGNPKTLTELHKETKKKYGLSVSFQAVMKAVNLLLSKKILSKKEKLYSIDAEWIFTSRNFIDRLYRTYFDVEEPIKKTELGKEVTVYTVTNLLELDRLWSDLLSNWARTEKADKRNVWKGRHCWWLIPRLSEEDFLHDLLLKNRIKTYNLLSERTPLDVSATLYYTKKGEKSKSSKKLKSNEDSHVSVFGDNTLKFSIPRNISDKLESIYTKTKNVNNLNLKKVLDIFKEKSEIEVTVIKDKFLSDKIKEEVINHF